MKVTRFCPAKVNLFLEVTGKRPNGYHELATLFAKINLGDTLTVQAVSSPNTSITLRLTGPIGKYLQADNSNLVWKAAQSFLDFFNIHATIDMLLDKHIPTGAGLGGGSSDAAGVLLSLCQIFNKDPHLLLDISAKLGADVPLFMHKETFLKGEGIGEKLTPIQPKGTLPWLLLIYPNTNVSTKGIFGRLKLPSQKETLTNLSKLDRLIGAVTNAVPFYQWKGLLFNRLEECVLPFTPEVKSALHDLQQLQPDGCLMSGSGSTVFTLVETEQAAAELASQLTLGERTCFITTFL